MRISHLVFPVSSLAAILLVSSPWVLAQSSQTDTPKTTQPDEDWRVAFQTPLATVGSEKLTLGEVHSFLRSRFPSTELQGQSREVAIATATQHLIHRRLVNQFLIEKNYAPSREEVDEVVAKFEAQAKAADMKLEDWIAKRKLTVDHFRFEAAWKLGWENYLEQKLDEGAVRRFFEQNRAQFDGSKRSVSQILLKVDGNESSLNSATQKLSEIRSEVLSGKLTWREAIQQHSEASSRNDAGQVGWIGFDGPMGKEFSKQAFELAEGEMSPVFTSRFGVHLIRCDAIRPGKLGFRDNYENIQAAAIQHRFNAIVQFQRPKTKVEFISQ